MHISPCERNYFPIGINSPAVLTPSDVTVEEQKIQAFREFEQLIESDPRFIRDGESQESTRAVLAFVVEATKQLYQDNWKEELTLIENKIRQIREEEPSEDSSYKKTTWLLNNIFLNLYEKSVATSSLAASCSNQPDKVKFYNRLFTNINNLKILSERVVKKEQPVPLGGLQDSYLPCWYLEHEVKKGHRRSRSM